MISLEKIEDSFELPIGTRFYFMGRIYEIVKSDDGRSGYPKCALFDDLFNNPMYQVCDLQRNERRDEKLIFLEKELNKIRRKTMTEYTYEDIIMDPNDPRLEGAIGKECYFSDYPKQLLNGARNNSPEYLDCLTDIRKEAACTFVDKNGSGWILIIIKKEEPKPKPKYVPFENAEEFLNAYDYTNHSVENGSVENKLINYGGIWLKDSEIDAYCMVTEIWDTGVVIGNKNITIGETTVFNDITSWDELLEDCTFINGTPCGKEVK